MIHYIIEQNNGAKESIYGSNYINALRLNSITTKIARLAYAIYLNTQDSFTDIINNIKYVFRLLNINSEQVKQYYR